MFLSLLSLIGYCSSESNAQLQTESPVHTSILPASLHPHTAVLVTGLVLGALGFSVVM